MKKVLFAFILLGTVLVAGNASADMIDGTIGFFGKFSPTGTDYDSTGKLSDAKGVAFDDNLRVVGASGDFSSVLGESAAFSSFTFDPVLTPSPVVSLWQAPASGPAFSFDLESIKVLQRNDLLLVLSGFGTIHGAGFDDTPGTWNFVGTSFCDINFSFSCADSSTPVGSSIPDPSVMVLLGSACLIGFVGTRRKRG